MQHFDLYAANMRQNAAAVAFLGKLEINCPFLLPRVSNNNFQSIWRKFQWINQYAAFLTCMQQRAAAGSFFIFLYNSCHFLLKNVLDNEFVSIQNNFWWKKTICSILACMQRVCSSGLDRCIKKWYSIYFIKCLK